MRRTNSVLASLCVMAMASVASAEIFGAGDNQFAIDFVTISGNTNPTGNMGYRAVPYDYRMGVFEITISQWRKFMNVHGEPLGDPRSAYDEGSPWEGKDRPATRISWYEAAQFVNWLNTSTGHQAAYKFTGTLGTNSYSFDVWQPGDPGYDVSNPGRNANAWYFLPTDNEWCKASYWNGTSLQRYATKDNSKPAAGIDANYDQRRPFDGPWDVGSGSEELNGTLNMMGNVSEWIEDPYHQGDYSSGSVRIIRGQYYGFPAIYSIHSWAGNPSDRETDFTGFRVASVPEPATLLLLGCGCVLVRRRKANMFSGAGK